MKIRSSPVIPSLICPGVPLDGAQAGVVVRIIDSDASVYANYLVQTADGTQYCGQMDVRRRRNRDALLRLALESGRSVMVIGGINSYVKAAMVGAPSHALFESTGGSNPNDARSGRP
ncbi:hypothetical protein AWB73_05549 [Caballeronia turbans]|jgi:hypothetical protein|uniref:hypothetical protein n=1 Tax=unclassified Caballeronia TaxID=2646786 RepID=UPI00074CE061|nr:MULTISPECIES: hypothetical protein [unclassified Caballeronia]SAL52436.1 hypothetical protein AWB73_05549 [Caballeronia turbans]